jgi:aminoglycoside phosphotransferase (APT) family kinase protein
MNDTLLSPQIQQWLRDAVSTTAAVASVCELPSSTSATLYGVDVQHNGRLLKLVLRLFTNAEWLADEPDLATHEAAALRKIAGIGVPVPKLVAVDEQGTHCGVPALLMTRVPGQVSLTPDDLDSWLRGLAGALLPIHDIDPGGFGWDHFSYNELSELQVPTWTRVPDLWAKAIAIVQGPAPDAPLHFIHRDYHPTNVLWQNSGVSGVVDWVNACRGAAGVDLAHCRLNLVSLYGVEAADEFLRAYEAEGGAEQHPFWDLLSLTDWLPGPGVYAPWLELGMSHLTDALVRERLDDYLVSVLRRI